MKNTILKNPSETEYGEPQWWIYLKSSRSIEITLESYGLEPEKCYYSVRYNCTDKEFVNDNFHDTLGVIDQGVTSDVGQNPENTLNEVIVLVKKIISTYNEEISEEE